MLPFTRFILGTYFLTNTQIQEQQKGATFEERHPQISSSPFSASLQKGWFGGGLVVVEEGCPIYPLQEPGVPIPNHQSKLPIQNNPEISCNPLLPKKRKKITGTLQGAQNNSFQERFAEDSFSLGKWFTKLAFAVVAPAAKRRIQSTAIHLPV